MEQIVPKFNKQIQHFANKLDLLWKGKLDSQINRKEFVKVNLSENAVELVLQI